MKKSEKKELLKNWPSMSIEERELKLQDLKESLAERKYKKLLSSIEKIDANLIEENNNVEEYVNNEESLENNKVDMQNEDQVEQDSEVDMQNEDQVEQDSEVDMQNEYQVEQDNKVDMQNEYQVEQDNKVDMKNENQVEEEIYANESWIIDDNKISIEDEMNSFDSSIYEEKIPSYTTHIPQEPLSTKNEFNSFKKQIGSDERLWNKNGNIIYSQEELIYKLSNSSNISDEEYKMLLISAQKKIEFIQLLIEKSRVKNAAYSYDFLNSMCWRVDKALKTFLATNKR